MRCNCISPIQIDLSDRFFSLIVRFVSIELIVDVFSHFKWINMLVISFLVLI